MDYENFSTLELLRQQFRYPFPTLKISMPINYNRLPKINGLMGNTSGYMSKIPTLGRSLY
ncbi:MULTISPECIES: hypothetical protein [unclassified Chryseobacterium]|uniref:hypothetical protein n=1 Tax=unclassified Chryseobacterium TaxID=2593645 RepID=UPI00300FACD0